MLRARKPRQVRDVFHKNADVGGGFGFDEDFVHVSGPG